MLFFETGITTHSDAWYISAELLFGQMTNIMNVEVGILTLRGRLPFTSHLFQVFSNTVCRKLNHPTFSDAHSIHSAQCVCPAE